MKIQTWDYIVPPVIESPLSCGSPLVSIYMGHEYLIYYANLENSIHLISSPDFLVNNFAILCLSIL